jgi:hypothetical protein
MNTNAYTAVSKPKVSIVGVDGNIQKLIDKVSEALRRQGHPASAMLMTREVERYATSFMAACAIVLRYVDFG